MKYNLDAILAVSVVTVISLGAGLVLEDLLSPGAATFALAVVLFASTATAWIRPGE
jgi:hypothetical protein